MKALIARLNADKEFQQRLIENEEHEKVKRRIYNRRASAKHRRLFPKKEQARQDVKGAIRRGDLVRPNRCSVDGCMRGRIEAHHYNGYDEKYWLDVIWLCHFHHMKEETKKLKAIGQDR